MTAADLIAFLGRNRAVMRVEITRVRGSSPREEGAVMFVAKGEMVGTIGGGQLEYMALDQARKLLNFGEESGFMDVPLGPEIGQCCGGRVEITLALMGAQAREEAIAQVTKDAAAMPHVYVFGAGHVGRALADQFQHLPLRCVLVDSRSAELALCQAQVETRLTALPEAEVRHAPAGSAFIVLTHDHALDFLLTSEVLARRDARWVGMIGSNTKRGNFESFARSTCAGLMTDTLNCPIGNKDGASGSRDKRPAVIAAMVVAEVIIALTSETAAQPVVAPS
ncbi:xanthine dehydrogenase accessory protein XdhC [Shimia marina]|uniref:Xanthine dehydrogenase accessory protein XdhC n=1 Tax=Shimia marina TaxID=321267 RepID=A0A0P1FAN3_9RHOB|nr:xanthine dehydrogenase accessory protein XdhC [Shimia marina]CUH53227.1 xanthine dehydrogenase accessory protein XdhC [Shimia marina]SFD82005.1 xanthine dehydrogenase accessory factor [Shimia marina]